MKKTILLSLSLVITSILQAQSPGGISQDLNYWLKADAGTTTFFDSGNNVTRVSNWTNQTPGSTNGVSQTPDFTSPIFITNGLNFNPALSFDGSNDAMSTNNGYDTNTQIVVFNPTQTVTSELSLELIITFQVAPGAFADSGIGIGNLASLACEDTYFLNSGDNDTTSPEYLACLQDPTFSSDDPFLAVCRENASGTLSEHRLWGEDKMAVINNPSEFSTHTDRPFTVGRRHSSNSFFFEGEIVEVISYSSRIAGTPLRQIESYLALKYGLTLDQSTPQDYINSNGVSIYDAGGIFNDFDVNIAGIGRDDASGLNQKQSRSSFEDALVTIGNGNIADDNLSNPNDFDTDLSSMVWGHNNESATVFDLFIALDVTEITYTGRTWALQETGTVGAVSISVPQSLLPIKDDQVAAIPVLLISENPTFDADDIIIELTDDGQGNFTTVVDLEDGSYFTFGIEDTILSIDDNEISPFSVYPNPATDFITVNLSLEQIEKVEIFDLNGRLIKTVNSDLSSSQNIDVSNLQSGLYFITVNTPDASITKKFIIDTD